MELSIVFPIYKKWELVHKRLWELNDISLPYTERMEVVLSDDFSEDSQVTNGLNFWRRKGPFNHLTTIENEKNLGFGGNINKAVSKSCGRVVVIQSTDVEVKGDFLNRILQILEEKPTALVGGRLINWDSGWNTFDGRIYPYLEGWLIACQRNTWDELGGFDPCFGRFDYEDMALSTKALEQGRELVALNSPFLVHSGGRTIYSIMTVDERMEHTEKNRKVFEKHYVKGKNNETSSPVKPVVSS